MRVRLGALARSGLESRVDADLPVAVNAALAYYVGKLGSGRGPAKFPKFLSVQGFGGEAPDPDSEAGLEVEVRPEIESALELEAAAQGVSIADLARHAVLVYLADLDLVEDPKPAPGGRIPA